MTEEKNKDITIVEAIARLIRAFQEDPDYAHTGHCNLARAFYDSVLPKSNVEVDQHKTANGGATIFMRRAFSVETSNDMLNSKDNDSSTDVHEEKPFARPPLGSFLDKIEELINTHGLERASNTPDYILAAYLKGCLENFDMCIRRRDKHLDIVTNSNTLP